MPHDTINWLQQEALSSDCPPQLLYRNGRSLDQQKGYMNSDQLNRQREIEAVFRRKCIRTLNNGARRHYDK